MSSLLMLGQPSRTFSGMGPETQALKSLGVVTHSVYDHLEEPSVEHERRLAWLLNAYLHWTCY